MVGIPSVWSVYLWFGGGTLRYFQFGWGSLGLVWEPLVTVSLDWVPSVLLGYPLFVWVPLVWWGYLSLVRYSQFGWGTLALEGTFSF